MKTATKTRRHKVSIADKHENSLCFRVFVAKLKMCSSMCFGFSYLIATNILYTQIVFKWKFKSKFKFK